MSNLSRVQAIGFGIWAERMGRAPTPAEIMARYPDIDRATAYRWRQSLLEAWGVQLQRRGIRDRLRTVCPPEHPSRATS